MSEQTNNTIQTPTPEPPQKKELTPEQLQQRRKRIAIPLFVLIFLGAMYWIFAPGGDAGQPAQDGTSGYNVEVPDPKEEDMPGSKKTAYEKAQLETEGKARLSLSELAGELMKANARSDEKPKPQKTPEENIRQSAQTYGQITQQLNDFYKPTKEQESRKLEEKVDELLAKLKTQEQVQDERSRQEQMMERSYQMAAKYLNPGTAAEQPVTVAPQSEKKVVAVQGVVRDDPTSSLPQQMGDSALLAALSARRNYGFNTAVGESYRMGANTIPACVSEDQTIVQGQRVRLRLLQAMQAGQVVIPAGSLVTGTASIQGERLEINIQSLEYKGNILPVELSVYDMDGQRGLFVPGSDDRNAAKEAIADVGSNMGNSISVTHSAGQQIAMDLSRGLIQSGTQLLSKKVRAVRITLKAGYKVLLVPKES